MKKNFLLSLIFLFVLTGLSLKSETDSATNPEAQTVSDGKTTAPSLGGLSEEALAAMDDIDPETIIEIEKHEPEFKMTWKMMWLGLLASADASIYNAKEYVSKHKIKCAAITGAASAATILAIICILKLKNNNKPTPGAIN